MSLRTSFAGLPLKNCIYNASGPRTGSVEALEIIGKSQAGAIVSKSATVEERIGNPLPRFVKDVNLGDSYGAGSISSEGLPNFGIDYCKLICRMQSLLSYCVLRCIRHYSFASKGVSEAIYNFYLWSLTGG